MADALRHLDSIRSIFKGKDDVKVFYCIFFVDSTYLLSAACELCAVPLQMAPESQANFRPLKPFPV